MRRSPAGASAALASPAPGEEARASPRLPREGANMRSTPLPRAAAASIVASAALGAFAAPASAVIALAPVRPCLSELDAVSPNASGLTPAGPVKLDLLSNGRLLLSTSSQPAAADGTYRIAKPYPSTVTDKWFPDQATETIPLQMNVTDLTRMNGGAPAASPRGGAAVGGTLNRLDAVVFSVGGAVPPPLVPILLRAGRWTARRRPPP